MTLSQCKKLKEWGLEQIETEYSSGYPDLEQLLEFANDRIHNRFGGENTYVEIHLPYDFYPQCLAKAVVGGRWGAPEYPVATDPDPKVAVYKLLEKILGEATP